MSLVLWPNAVYAHMSICQITTPSFPLVSVDTLIVISLIWSKCAHILAQANIKIGCILTNSCAGSGSHAQALQFWLKCPPLPIDIHIFQWKVLGVTTPLVVMNIKYKYQVYYLSPHILKCHRLCANRVSIYLHIYA